MDKIQEEAKKRFSRAQNVTQAAGPADAGPDMGGMSRCGKSRRLRDIDGGCVKTTPLHAQRRVCVLGDRFRRDTSDSIQSRAPDQGTRTAKEGRVPEIIAVLNNAVKEFRFIGNRLVLQQIAFEWIRRIEVVGRLQHSKMGIREHPAERHLQKAAGRNVIAIEYCDVWR